MELRQVVVHLVRLVNSTLLQEVQVAQNVLLGNIKANKEKRVVCHAPREHTVHMKEKSLKLHALLDYTVLVAKVQKHVPPDITVQLNPLPHINICALLDITVQFKLKQHIKIYALPDITVQLELLQNFNIDAPLDITVQSELIQNLKINAQLGKSAATVHLLVQFAEKVNIKTKMDNLIVSRVLVDITKIKQDKRVVHHVKQGNIVN